MTNLCQVAKLDLLIIFHPVEYMHTNILSTGTSIWGKQIDISKY